MSGGFIPFDGNCPSIHYHIAFSSCKSVDEGGTGACATAVAAFINGLTGRKSDIIMDGGTVTIEWDEISGHILMTGPATKVFDGEIEDKY